jgi:Polyketide cyclase / dehydrase and lipid transport
MTRLESVIDIRASRERVWEILIDVERWPDWTPTFLSVQRGDSGALSVGSRAYIRQPKIRPAWWEVTELAAPRNFTWISRNPGVRVTAGHVIEAVDGGSRLTLSLEFSGLLSFLLFPLMRDLSQSYIATEAQKLKERSER